MKRWLLSLFLVASSAAALAEMPRMNLSVGMYRIDAEVASDNPNRMQGLMYRKIMAPHQGMLFVFPQVTTHCMWMRNTFLPLSVAFLDEAGKIINIEDMEPQTENSHCAARPARFALEMNKGWFGSKKIKSGAVIQGLDKAPAPR